MLKNIDINFTRFLNSLNALDVYHAVFWFRFTQWLFKGCFMGHPRTCLVDFKQFQSKKVASLNTPE